MSVPRVCSVALLAVMIASAVHCRHHPPGPRIPPRCREASVTPVSCAGTNFFDNLLPHPDDCQLFYYCVTPSSRPICRQCPARLHFNPRLHVCDHPAFAGCNVPTSTTASPETTTSVTTTEATTSVTTTAAPATTESNVATTTQTEAVTTEGPNSTTAAA